ncbi:hypothetical protein [Streptomyces sp. NPDC056154]|uniref:hypothetical protein n=1 Tax=unclassified Streptomyces TaxID=2593676 RepID=UPI0035D77081
MTARVETEPVLLQNGGADALALQLGDGGGLGDGAEAVAEDRAAAAVFTYVLGNATGAAATAALTRRIERDGGDAEEVFGATMKEAAEVAARFPRLRSRVDAALVAGYAEAPHDTFGYGLRSLLDGLAARLPRANG